MSNRGLGRWYWRSVGLVIGTVLVGCSLPSGEPGGPAAGRDSEIRLAFVTNGVASFWNVAAAGVKAGEEEFGVRCDTLMPQGNADQKRMIEDLVARGVHGIAVSPIDADNQTQVLNEAAQHTVLITQDCDAPDSDRLCYIGMDNYMAGRMAGELVKEALPEGGNLMIFVGRLEQVNARLRRQGVIDELMDRSVDRTRYDPPGETIRGEKYVILDTRTDGFDPGKAKAQAEDAIARYPDLDAMVGLFAYNPPLCLAAVEEAGKLDRIRVIGFDEEEGTLQGILDGKIHGTVVQNPFEYGRRSVEVLKALVEGDFSVIPEDAFIDIPAQQIRRDNVQEFWDDLRAKIAASTAAGAP
ncbi:MAG: sugar ABC transporter substrate-binding protein [Planctomycetaceae bacterium]|nr:MAG: sugar ABC transporter substrate-binding protein [Planctomycetaceae bacterium]